MIQQIFIVIIFLAALGYLAWLVYNAFKSGDACSSGCGKCGAIDFDRIRKELKK